MPEISWELTRANVQLQSLSGTVVMSFTIKHQAQVQILTYVISVQLVQLLLLPYRLVNKWV